MLEVFARTGSRSDTEAEVSSAGRRAVIIGTAIMAGTLAGKSALARKKTDGGLADILPKQAPQRDVPLTPPGSKSVKHFYQHCTACQLCVAQCPGGVLRPSADLEHLMQPEMSYEKGWCKTGCTRCSELCPAGAITRITPQEKTAYHIGTAHCNADMCISASRGVSCGKCASECPSGAILMVDDGNGRLRPAVAEELCTGCGACEQYCPVRPVSAITVNGREEHV